MMPPHSTPSSALARTEGILPALESAHAVAEAMRIAPTLAPREILVVNLSGRGDKDMGIMPRRLKLSGSLSALQCRSASITSPAWSFTSPPAIPRSMPRATSPSRPSMPALT